MDPVLRISFALFSICLLSGQTVDKSLTFDVASVKPADLPQPDGRGRIMMSGPTGGPGTKDPGRIHYPYMTLRNLLTTAFDVKNFQISGPAFLDSERFEVNATMPPDTTRDQFRVMLRNLLAERFKMTSHRETKELPMYALAVAKGGPKMKEAPPVPASADDAEAPAPPSQPKIGADGFPIIPLPARGGLFMITMPGRSRLMGEKQTMQDLCLRLTNLLSRPVTDSTGLSARYDFVLTFSGEGMSAPAGAPAGGAMVPVAPPPAADNVFRPGGEAPPDLFTAVQAQLGLKLEAKKGPVEIVVIDHIEKTVVEN